ncbi:MAG TPA: hypothetical protein V6C81_22695 [Planktothrix sp.]|jgi:hypothetical protein
MRTQDPNQLCTDPSTAPLSGLEKHHKALRKWLNYPDGNTEYGATLYTTIAACYETQGNLAQAENFLIEGYKLCRNDNLTDKAADIAERLHLLLWSQIKTCPDNEFKAMAWRKLCDQLRRENYRKY